jgi:reverse gyrase
MIRCLECGGGIEDDRSMWATQCGKCISRAIKCLTPLSTTDPTADPTAELVGRLNARIAELEREVSDLKTREAVIAARERQTEKFMARVRAFIGTCDRAS